jgi:hypothetical protein
VKGVDYGRAGTKAARLREIVHDHLLADHYPDDLPTSGRFVFYELEQRGDARKPDPRDRRPNKRRERGWPPGAQDVTDALTWLREQAVIPWSWLVDESRQLDTWLYAATVADYLRDRIPTARINPWGDEPPPLILCESKATAGVLRAVVAEYVCPIAGTAGHAAGFLRTEIAPLLHDDRDEGEILLGVDLRRVLYLGDLDRSGDDIEANALRVLEHEAEREIDWTRVAMTEEQAHDIEPIWKVDGRDVVALVRGALDALLPEPLAEVRQREAAQRAASKVA